MFKIGDKVRILSNIDDLIDDFSGEYIEEMELDLGKETEIIEIYKENEKFIGYVLKNSDYVWDERALELIKNDKWDINSTEFSFSISIKELTKAWKEICEGE